MNIFKLWNNIYQVEADGDAGSPPPAEGGEGDDKGSLLSDNSNELGEGEFFLSEGIKGTGDKPDWYVSDKYKTIADQAQAYPAVNGPTFTLRRNSQLFRISHVSQRA